MGFPRCEFRRPANVILAQSDRAVYKTIPLGLRVSRNLRHLRYHSGLPPIVKEKIVYWNAKRFLTCSLPSDRTLGVRLVR